MHPPVEEPAIKLAAALTTHWERRDIEAVVLLLADLDKEDAQDIIVALLLLREKSMEDIARMLMPRELA